MGDAASDKGREKLPEGLAARLETQTGARIIAVRPRAGGGASRDGAEIDLLWPDGRTQDAYLTYERAYAERIPFDELQANDSPWPAYPTVISATVEIGRLPGGVPITGTVTRTRFADTGNYPFNGGAGTVATNPAAMNIWRVQSVLTYRVGNVPYSKARTVLRSQ